MSFVLPEGADTFVNGVESRVSDLIDTGIWDIPHERFTGWFDQFVSPEERFLGACLLDALIYRTRPQFIAGAAALYRGALRWALKTEVPGIWDTDLLTAIQSRHKDPGIRLIPVICDNDPPTKSGPLVLRYIKRALNLDERWMAWPWQVPGLIQSRKASIFILVDDFLGSGCQFNAFVESQKLPIDGRSARWLYAPIVAHTRGAATVRAAYPSIEVFAAEHLDESHGFFSSQTWQALTNGAIRPEDARAYYDAFLDQRQLDFHPRLGFGDLGLCFGFSHSTPNNSLPVFWRESANWRALMPR